MDSVVRFGKTNEENEQIGDVSFSKGPSSVKFNNTIPK